VNVNVTVAGGGGHSSMPPPGGATVIEAAAKLVAAMTASPLPSVLQSPMSDFLQALAPEAPLYLRPLMRHCTLP
jgi:carboxypeptidase PM20D1